MHRDLEDLRDAGMTLGRFLLEVAGAIPLAVVLWLDRRARRRGQA